MDIAAQLRTALAAQSLPPASSSFLTNLIDSRTPPPPLASLLATAKARILACDLTNNNNGGGGGGILDAAAMAGLPPDAVGNPHAEAAQLPRDVYVQVLDVENLSLSRWAQMEDLEAIASGERTRGREIVRVATTTADDDDDATQQLSGGSVQQQACHHPAAAAAAAAAAAVVAPRNAVHRLVLQDCRGKTAYAVETRRMEARVGVGRTAIGEKVLLRQGTVVARGSVLLVPERTVFLGGKVEAWHEAWVKGRLARLKAAVGGDADRPQ